MISRRTFVTAAAIAPVAATSLSSRASAQATLCTPAHLGSTRDTFENRSCQTDIHEADGLVVSTMSWGGEPIAQSYARFENDRCAAIESRAFAENYPMEEAHNRLLSGVIPGRRNINGYYAQTIGLMTKPVGYAAIVGHSDQLAELNGRSGYYLAMMACDTHGADAAGSPPLDAVTVTTTYCVVETEEPFEVVPNAEDNQPRLGARATDWTTAYGEGQEGEYGNTYYADLAGSPQVHFQRQMQADARVFEISAYGLTQESALQFAGTFLPADAALESTFLIRSSPNWPFSIRVQQYTTEGGQVPMMAMYIYRGNEGEADLDAVILSRSGQIAGWNAAAQ